MISGGNRISRKRLRNRGRLRAATGHLAAATAIHLCDGRLRRLRAGGQLRQGERQAANDGQHRFHDLNFIPTGESRKTFFGFRPSIFGVLELGLRSLDDCSNERILVFV